MSDRLSMTRSRRLWRSPVFHFIVVGALLFLGDRWWAARQELDERGLPSRTVVIDDARLEQIRNEIRVRSTLLSTLAYTLVLIGIATVVVNAQVFFVLPQFGKVFISLGRPAPPMTQLLLDAAQILRAHSLLLLGGLVATMLALWRVRHTERATRCWDRAILNLPLLRDASRLLLAGRMFRLIGTMLQTGVPLLESVRLCRSAVKNQFFRNVFDTMEREVLNGNGIGKTIGEATFIPAGAAQMIATAEKT